MRIAIVHPLARMVELLRQILGATKDDEVAWAARDGADAVRKCLEDRPDLVLMDLALPVMDGVEATRRIMQDSPCPILILTSAMDGDTPKIFEAMGTGALDAVNVPALGSGEEAWEGGEALIKRIETIRRLRSPSPQDSPGIPRPGIVRDLPTLVVIGASTGGPKALATLLSGLPGDLHAAVICVQHVGAEFSDGLAKWLTGQTRLPVRLAVTGSRPQPSTILLAGGNDHLILSPDLTLAYAREPSALPFRPSVDVFFKSVSENWPLKGVAVLLTGMGRDGAEGLAALRRRRWYTIAQDEATSAVYGMPKAARDLGAAVDILAIGRIAPAILTFLERGRPPVRVMSWEW